MLMSTYASFSITNLNQLKRYILLRLGAPLLSVELTDEHLDLVINEATEIYSKYANVDQRFMIVQLSDYVEDVGVTLPADVIGVFSIDKNMATNDFGNLFAVDNSLIYSVFNYMSPLPRMFSFTTMEITKQYMDLVNLYSGKNFDFNFNPRNKLLVLYPDPIKAGSTYAAMSIVLGTHIVRPEAQLYGEAWIKKYALAEAKVLLGTIRKKFKGVQLLGGGVIDDSIGAEGIIERDALLANLQSQECPICSFSVG
jgi:hypothetical protein